MTPFPELIQNVIAWGVPLVIAIVFHEVAHGVVAYWFHDDTAKRMRRLTLNPLRHIDRMGTVIIPLLLIVFRAPFVFGYAKPVPVDFARLKPQRMGMFMVAIAGVVTNFILALISAAFLHIESVVTPEQAPLLFRMLYLSIQINCVLIVVNMLPILPLDGGRAVAALLPRPLARQWAKLERIGFPLLLILMLTSYQFNLNIMERLIGTPAYWLVEQVLHITGNGA